jgi:hypothetical protein
MADAGTESRHRLTTSLVVNRNVKHKGFAMRKLWEVFHPVAIFAALALCGFVFGWHGESVAQQFQWVYPLVGANPAPTLDFSNPPMSTAPQGLTSAFQSPLAQPQTEPIGSVAYASVGNSTTYGASGTIYVSEIVVTYDMTTTNCNFLAGATIGTNTVICVLFNSAGTPIANTLLTGTATAGANTFQTIAWTATKALQTGRYFIGVMANGTTDNLKTTAASTFIGKLTTSATGTFGTVPTLTVPTTFTANVGPVAYLN